MPNMKERIKQLRKSYNCGILTKEEITEVCAKEGMPIFLIFQPPPTEQFCGTQLYKALMVLYHSAKEHLLETDPKALEQAENALRRFYYEEYDREIERMGVQNPPITSVLHADYKREG